MRRCTLRKVALNWRGMQVAAGILYSQVPSVMRRPVFSSVMTSSLVNRPSPCMKAPSTCKHPGALENHIQSFVRQALVLVVNLEYQRTCQSTKTKFVCAPHGRDGYCQLSVKSKSHHIHSEHHKSCTLPAETGKMCRNAP